MHLEDGLAIAPIRFIDHDLSVEAAGAHERLVEHVGPVRGGHDDDAGVRVEAVHLDEQLVERVLALVVAADHAVAPARAADGIHLVDEDDARRLLLGILEQIAHAARAHAHEHLHEVGARDGEERHARLARDGLRHERLAGAGRADEQHALRQLAAEPRELLGVLEKLDDLDDLFLCFAQARHVVERDLVLFLRVEQLRRVLANVEDLRARVHPAEKKDPQPHDDNQRNDPREHAAEPVLFLRGRKLDDRAVVGAGLLIVIAEELRELVVAGLRRGETAALLARGFAQQVVGRRRHLHNPLLDRLGRVHPADARVVDHLDARDVSFFHVVEEGTVLDDVGLRPRIEDEEVNHQRQKNGKIDPHREPGAAARRPLARPTSAARWLILVALILRHMTACFR